MKNIFNKLFLTATAIFALVGCSNEELPPIINQPDEVKVESISFVIENDLVYVDHYVQLKDFEVLPLDATNKDVEWYLEDNTLGEVIKDKVYGYKPGETYVVCKALDGSDVLYKQPLKIMALNSPSSMSDINEAYCTLGVEVTPDVQFYPYISTTDQRYVIDVEDKYKDYVQVTEDNKIIGIKKGDAEIKICSASNPNLFKYFKVHFEEDLFASASIVEVSKPHLTYLQNYEDRTTVMGVTFDYTPSPSWPDVRIKLPRPINLGKESISLDYRFVSGKIWSSLKFLDEEGKPIVTYIDGQGVQREEEFMMNEDASKGWKTTTIQGDEDYDKEVHYIKLHVETTRPEGDTTSERLQFYFDNLVANEIPLTEIELLDQEIDIDLENPYQVQVNYLPENTTSKRFALKVEEGYEGIVEIVDGTKIKGLKANETAYVVVYSPFYEGIENRLKVNVHETIPHSSANKYYKNKEIQTKLTNPVDISNLYTNALAFEFKLVDNGYITFTLNDEEPNIWHNISSEIILTKQGDEVACNIGKITPTEDLGWYTVTINERDLHGDGKNAASSIDIIYGPASKQTTNSYIDLNSIRVVEAHSTRNDERIQTYTTNNVVNNTWHRFTLAKLSLGGGFAFDFKMEEDGELTYSIYDDAHGGHEVMKDITIRCLDGEVSSNLGEITSLGDNWYTILLPYSAYSNNEGAINASHIDTFRSKQLTTTITIDWSSMRLVYIA